jgi:GNAT superfamily N-acetyltransferase
MRLVLSRASPADFDQLVPLSFRSFEGDPLLPVFQGHESPSSYAHLNNKWTKGTRNRTDIWLKVEDVDAEADIDVRDEQGNIKGKQRRIRIVGASNWKIYATYVPPKDGHALGPSLEDLSYLPAEQERRDAQRILMDIAAARRRDGQEPHLLCYLVFVDPEYQRQGVGTMLMQWGNDVADAMMLSCWLEASAKGKGLYRKLGYEEASRMEWETESFGTADVVRMKRERRVEEMEGRGLKRTA